MTRRTWPAAYWSIIPCLLAVASLVNAQPPKALVPPPPKVIVTPVVEQDVAEGRTFVGTVKPLRKSLVGSATAGRVEEYLVNEGDRVAKGQPIAKLRTGIIEAELSAAQAALKVAQAELAELENGSRPEEIEQAKARLKMAEAMRAFRLASKDRTVELGTAVSQEQLDQTIALAVESEGAAQDAQAALTLLEQGPRREKVDQARARVEMAAAEVQRLSEQLDRHTMFAPFDGFVTIEHTEVGQWLMQGDPVAEIVELDQVDVEIPVLEDYVARLVYGAQGSVEIGALGVTRKPFTGRLEIINPQADTRARTFPVKVRVENEIKDHSALIKAGMFARVTLPVGEPTRALLVPKDAIVLGGPAPVVYVADAAGPKQTVRPVPVMLGVFHEALVQVSGDLKAGQLVVIEGNERLRPGQEVRTEQAAPATSVSQALPALPSQGNSP